jgi:hypothetical protein
VTTPGGTATSASSFTIGDTERTTRIEETDSAVSYAGAWDQGYTGAPGGWSGGSVAFSAQTSAQATLSFTGTGVSWIGYRSTNTGIATVSLDGIAVATVDTYAPSDTVQAVLFTTSGLVSGPHTLAVEVTGTKNDASSDFIVVVDAFDVKAIGTGSSTSGLGGEMFESGDVFISLETGPVQWRHPNGTLEQILVNRVPGTGEGMGLDPNGNLYVTRWCTDSSCLNGNAVEMFNDRGQSQGIFGTGYNCAPHAIVFDAAGTAYVGQAACRGSILKFVPGRSDPIEFAVAPENYGAFWIDLAPDGCTMYYTSYGPNVLQFDVCAGVQLRNFNAAPLPGGAAQDLRALPDGGVLVSSGEVIARLNASGLLIQTYTVPTGSNGNSNFWAGLDLVGDGTFWAGNYESSNVYRFDLASGAVLFSFNTGTPSRTVVGVRVKK